MVNFNPGYEGPGASSADRRPDPASAGVRRGFVLLSCLPTISLFPAGVRGHARACVNARRRSWLAQLIVYVARSREPEARTNSAPGHEPGPASEYSPLSFLLNVQWRIE